MKTILTLVIVLILAAFTFLTYSYQDFEMAKNVLFGWVSLLVLVFGIFMAIEFWSNGRIRSSKVTKYLIVAFLGFMVLIQSILDPSSPRELIFPVLFFIFIPITHFISKEEKTNFFLVFIPFLIGGAVMYLGIQFIPDLILK